MANWYPAQAGTQASGGDGLNLLLIETPGSEPLHDSLVPTSLVDQLIRADTLSAAATPLAQQAIDAVMVPIKTANQARRFPDAIHKLTDEVAVILLHRGELSPEQCTEALQRGVQDIIHLGQCDNETIHNAVSNAVARQQSTNRLLANQRAQEDFIACSADWHWSLGPDLRFNFISNRFVELIGQEPEDVIGRTRAELYANSMDAEFLEAHMRQLARHEPFAETFQIANQDGGKVYLEIFGVPVFDRFGNFTGYRGAGHDRTEETQLSLALQKSQQQAREFAELSADWFWETDTSGHFSSMAGRVEEILGVSINQLMETPPSDAADTHSVNAETVNSFFELLATEKSFSVSGLPWQRSDGGLRYLYLRARPMLDDNGTFTGFRGVGRDVTDQETTQRELTRKSKLLQLTFEHMDQAISVVDSDLNISNFNQRFLELLDFPPEQFPQGAPFEQFIRFNAERGEYGPGDAEAQLHERLVLARKHQPHHFKRIRPNGTVLDIRGAPLPDGGFVTTYTDITTAHTLEEKLTWQAEHDGLTGLINRRAFEQRLLRVLEQSKEGEHSHALCYLDLDQFKVVNDTCGHLAGDELLRQISDLLARQVRHRDTLARLGGDEFALLMEHCPLGRAEYVAMKIRDTVDNYRFAWEERQFRVGVSIGLVALPGNGHLTLSEVLGMADAACYAAKEAGRNRVHLYQHSDQHQQQRSGEIRRLVQLQEALDEQRLLLYWQPAFALGEAHTGHPSHGEVLLRLRQPDGRISTPAPYLAAAERYDMAEKLDRWVVKTTFAWLAGHRQRLHQLSYLAINLSAQSLASEDFQQFLLGELRRLQLPGKRLCFEITETAAIRNLGAARRFINILRREGCRFALDDFGSGLSSFAYLKSLPVDFIKIDGQFVRDILHNPVDLAMVAAINHIGHVMGKKTIAEFVESDQLYDKLSEMGVDFGQGFALGKPRPLGQLHNEE